MGDVLSPTGLDIYDEVARRGLVAFSLRKGRLVVRSTRFTGLIPLNDRLAIRIVPKTPIRNVLHFILRSDAEPEHLAGFTRSYGLGDEEIGNPESLYARSYITALAEVRRRGALKKYIQRTTNRELRGRFLLGQTVTRSLSKGLRGRPVFSMTEFTTDNPENRIVKRMGERILEVLREDASPGNREDSDVLCSLLGALASADSARISRNYVVRQARQLIRGLPSHRAYYADPLWLAFLVAARKGFSIEDLGEAHFDTLIVDLSAVFEAFIRSVCEDMSPALFGGCRAIDGNKHPVSLFGAGAKLAVHPDVYFEKDGKARAVLDVKYKAEPSTSDRYELIAFCEALGVQRGIFICPLLENGERCSHYGTTPSGKDLYVARFDLAADPIDEEQAFRASLSSTLGQ